MVANAGVAPLQPFVESERNAVAKIHHDSLRTSFILYILLSAPVEVLDKAMAVNIRGTMLCYKYAALQMISQGRGGRLIGE